MISSLVTQILNIREKPVDPLCPRCNERPRHRTALEERLTSYCIHCHREIKKNAQKQK
jgi:hypothetical protein